MPSTISALAVSLSLLFAPPSNASNRDQAGVPVDPLEGCPTEGGNCTAPGTPEPSAAAEVPPAPTTLVEKKVECKREDFETFEEFVDCQLAAAEGKEMPSPERKKLTEREALIQLYAQMHAASEAKNWALYYELKEQVGILEGHRFERVQKQNRSYEEMQTSSDYDERDNRLVGLTTGFGIGWGVSLILVGVFSGLYHTQASDCINTAISSARVGVSCERATGIAAAMWVFAATSSGTGVGLLTSGIFLGVHRANPPRLSLSPTGVRLKF